MGIEPWWIDATLIAFAIMYVVDGYRRGFLQIAVEVFGFAFSLLAAFLLYTHVAGLVLLAWDIPRSFANAGSFFVLWVLCDLLYPMFARRFYRAIPEAYTSHPWNKYLGFIPALLDEFVLALVILPLLVSLPLPLPIKDAVLQSRFGAPIALASTQLNNKIEGVFSPAVRDGLAFTTVHPDSHETIPLKFRTSKHAPDELSETRMFQLVNQERLKAGLPILTYDASLRDLSRRYAETMLESGFFSHVGRDGSSPGDRATNMSIPFKILGENLALSPDVMFAHDGLMHSPGHRANILSRDYRRLGVGVIDAGVYGKMFVQEFAD